MRPELGAAAHRAPSQASPFSAPEGDALSVPVSVPCGRVASCAFGSGL